MTTDRDALGAAESFVARFEPVGGSPDLGLLTAAERARRERFVHARDRDAYAAAHLLARSCVAAFAGIAPGEVRFRQCCERCGGPHGRPVVVAPDGVHVSWSHTRGYVAAVAASAPCGIDVEAILDRAPPRRALTTAEESWIRGLPEPRAGFAELWVRKEALIKAGLGTLGSIATLDVLADDAPARGYRGVRLLGWSAPGFRGAVALTPA